MIVFYELQEICRAQVFTLLSESIFHVEEVDALLVRHDYITVIGYALCYPVMPADGFQPPDFIDVLKSDAVHFVCTVLFQQSSEAQYAFTRCADIGKYNGYKILFSDAFFHQRVRPLYARVGGNGFRCRHGNVRLIDAGSAPDALVRQSVRHGGITQRVIRKVYFDTGDDRFIMDRLVGRIYDDQLFRCKMTAAGILIPCHQS